MAKYGRLEVITGPMCSGKSRALIRRLRAFGFDEGSVLAIRHAADTRSRDGTIESRDGESMRAITVGCASDLIGLTGERRGKKILAIGIDETQFFDAGIVTVADSFADSGVIVVCAGLELRCDGLPFGSMPLLMAMADSVTKLRARCARCGKGPRKNAVRTQYIGGGPAPTGAELRPGGAELYEPRCRECFIPTGLPNGAATGT